GVLLSNSLGAFSETGPNEVAPGKRMASSMSPTVVSRGGKALAVVGSPGGDTIPAIVAQLVRNLVDGGMNVEQATRAPRIYHPLLPERVRTETRAALPKPVITALLALGHPVEASPIPLGDAKLIVVDETSSQAWAFA